MDNTKNGIDASFAAMHLIEINLGKEIFMRLNLAAKEIILDTLQQELQKLDSLDLQKIYQYKLLPQTGLGHSLYGATRAKPLILKGSINPLRVREGDCGNSGESDVSPI